MNPRLETWRPAARCFLAFGSSDTFEFPQRAPIAPLIETLQGPRQAGLNLTIRVTDDLTLEDDGVDVVEVEPGIQGELSEGVTRGRVPGTLPLHLVAGEPLGSGRRSKPNEARFILLWLAVETLELPVETACSAVTVLLDLYFAQPVEPAALKAWWYRLPARSPRLTPR